MARIPLNKFVSTVKVLSSTIDNGPFDYNSDISGDYRSTLIYPGPPDPSVTSIILNVQCSNISTLSSRESITLGISAKDGTSDGRATGTIFYYLVRNFRVNKQYTSGLTSGKILLQYGESLHGSCSKSTAGPDGRFTVSVAVLEAFNDPN